MGTKASRALQILILAAMLSARPAAGQTPSVPDTPAAALAPDMELANASLFAFPISLERIRRALERPQTLKLAMPDGPRPMFHVSVDRGVPFDFETSYKHFHPDPLPPPKVTVDLLGLIMGAISRANEERRLRGAQKTVADDVRAFCEAQPDRGAHLSICAQPEKSK